MIMHDAAHSYFRLVNPAVETDPEFPPQFFGIDEIPIVDVSPGVRFRPVFGHNILLNYVYFEPHAEAPLHQHTEEQMGTSIQGVFEFTLNGMTRLIHPGDVY